jgi:flagellar biosynthesis chaperone FliJ|tara:strand:+ start:254 stop:403 length:150 start_codon:yes stop_codon:yes gene_type:complete
MPSEREMAEAYISQVETQLEQLKENVSKLEIHLSECRKELEEKKEEGSK